MKKIRKRKIRPELKYMLYLIGFCIFVWSYLYFTNDLKYFNSIHTNASLYEKRNVCRVFYPKSDVGKKYAKQICESLNETDKKTYDYGVIKYGDYYLITYGNGIQYYLDTNFKSLKINSFDENYKNILSDYLRYEAKKQIPHIGYTTSFLEETYYQNLDMSKLKFSIELDKLKVQYNDYDLSCLIPLKYVSKAISMNFGFDDEIYRKPRYIDPSVPMIALTYDDGPFSYVGKDIVDELYKYDGAATFFIVGNRVYNESKLDDFDTEMDYLKYITSLSNQVGSHTNDHINLRKADLSQAIEQVNLVADKLKEIDYDVTIYRSPYGIHSKDVTKAVSKPDILWNVDSQDWQTRDKEQIMSNTCLVGHGEKCSVKKNSVVLMHELYDSTKQASIELIKYYVDNGYQLVTISEMINALGLNQNEIEKFAGK